MSSETKTSATAFLPPRCVFVTGPSGPGRLRWLDEELHRMEAAQPDARGALLLAETSVAGAKRFAGRTPRLEVHCLAMPCLCCPALADLPGAARRLIEASRAQWLFIELPPLPAASLIAEFDRRLGWPREIVVWLNREWIRSRQAQSRSMFQENLLALADRVVEESAPEPASARDPDAPELSFLEPPIP